MQKGKWLLVLVLLVVIGLYGFVRSGIFNVAATVDESPFLNWILHTTMENSVRSRAGNIEVPDLDGREFILGGLSDYVAMCAGCHGEPGEDPGYIGRGLNPPPPELAHLAEHWNAAEQFWIVKNGVRMTGMPAFGETHEAEELWPVIAFLQSARDMSVAEYRRMKAAAEGYGHHASGEGKAMHNGTNGHHDEEADDDHDSSHDASGSAGEVLSPEKEHEHGAGNHTQSGDDGDSGRMHEDSGGHDHASHEHDH